MQDNKDKISKNFGKDKFAKEDNQSTQDFEESFMKFISSDEESEYYENLGRKFGKKKFGEIDNSEIEDFKDSLEKI